KTPEQQSCLMLHRTRHLFIRQQTAVINSIRAHLAEFGIVAPVGRKGVTELLHVVADPSDRRVPEVARACLAALGTQLLRLKQQILEFDRLIMAWHRSNQTSKRLHYIPGVGPMLATALVASVADPRTFRSDRNVSAWIGLVPKQHSSGGKDRLGSISKKGDLRSLFVAGALAVIRYAKLHGTNHRPWLTTLLARRPTKVAAIALANKLARMAWALMTRGERYNYPVDPAVRTTHLCHCISRMRAFDRDLIRGRHYGQRSCEPHSKAEHMAAPTQACHVRFSLPTWSRPHMARSVSSVRRSSSVAIGGK